MKTDKKYTIGFIGCGHMGMAIAKGCAKSDYIERFNICVYDHNEKNMNIAKGERFGLAHSEKEVAENSHIVILAMTPSKADIGMKAIKDVKCDCVLSLVTGLSISHMQDILGKETPIIRAMPNTPLQLNAGSTALCKSENCKADEYDFVFKMFAMMGAVRTIPEEQMNAIVTVHGSTPAYIYYFVECLLEDAKNRGIDEDDARALLVQTVIGSGMLLASDPHKPFAEFVNEVATKGGTTEQAILTLKENDLMDIVHKANEKCIARAEELSA